MTRRQYLQQRVCRAWAAAACVSALAGCMAIHVQPATSATCVAPPALNAIIADSLRRDLFALASDTFRGREAGTVDELRAAAWIARRARDAGLRPAGDDGSYFQFFAIRRTRQAPSSSIRIGTTPLAIWRDAVLVTPTSAHIDAPIVFVGNGSDADLVGRDIRGQVVAAMITAPEHAPPLGPMLTARRYAMLAVRERAAALVRRGARAVLLVSDSVADAEYDNIAAWWAEGDWRLATARGDTTSRAPVIWLRRRSLHLVRRSGARLVADLAVDEFDVPSVNVVAVAPGRDSVARRQYVLFSAHTDALGVRFSWAGDSIWHGADDNASTSVALLAIGRAFVAAPAAASALFVWHGAEEPGLLGSSWYVSHPTVPKSAIRAVLNGDMIGRNSPDSAALLGSQPPNRTSIPLVQAALGANELVAHFAIDSTWDRPGHPESFFRRSDHWPYVRAAIPAIYFSTLLHADYHNAARRDVAHRLRKAHAHGAMDVRHGMGGGVSARIVPAPDQALIHRDQRMHQMHFSISLWRSPVPCANMPERVTIA